MELGRRGRKGRLGFPFFNFFLISLGEYFVRRETWETINYIYIERDREIDLKV